ncbi:MAG: TOPRIM nucleotidyl transferase/hydrolase domain-containing protein [Thomasclavelia sp.]
MRKLLTLPEYEKLSQQYIAYIQVGGAYAYNYRKLIELLKIKTLIITDLDYDKDAVTEDNIKKSKTTNATINSFYKETDAEEPTIEQLYDWKEE